jgi:hypothetical protein
VFLCLLLTVALAQVVFENCVISPNATYSKGITIWNHSEIATAFTLNYIHGGSGSLADQASQVSRMQRQCNGETPKCDYSGNVICKPAGSFLQKQSLTATEDPISRQTHKYNWFKYFVYDTGRPINVGYGGPERGASGAGDVVQVGGYSHVQVRIAYRPEEVGEFEHYLQIQNTNDEANACKIFVVSMVSECVRWMPAIHRVLDHLTVLATPLG